MRVRVRRAALISLVAVLVLAAAGLTAWWLAQRDPDRISTEEPPREPDRISAQELRDYPPIVVVWSDNGRARNTASGDVHVLRPDGTGVRRVKAWKKPPTQDGVFGAYDAHWSPDRELIALTLGAWHGDPYGQVAVASPDGRLLRKLSPTSNIGNVAWSPDGRELVYSHSGDLWTVSPDRRKRTRIFKSAHYLLSGTDWMPDGRHVAAGTQNGIVNVSRDGAKVVKLTGRYDGDPAWSPDGRALAFLRASDPYGDSYDLYIVGADGQGVRRLVSNAGALLWSRNGRSILFTEGHEIGAFGMDGRIGVIGSDGRHRRTLASGDALAWSPDGRKILFERQVERRSELWVMDADGGRQTRLRFGRPGWSVLQADWGR